ncbi:MAG: hypothetical protein V1835_02180 [Candidatus Micrarchaeota archaeon]
MPLKEDQKEESGRKWVTTNQLYHELKTLGPFPSASYFRRNASDLIRAHFQTKPSPNRKNTLLIRITPRKLEAFHQNVLELGITSHLISSRMLTANLRFHSPNSLLREAELY